MTGESQWDEEKENIFKDHSIDHQEIEMITTNNSSLDYSDVEEEEEDSSRHHSSRRLQPGDYVKSDDDEGEDIRESDELLISNLVDKDILYRTKRDITIFTYCFIIHAIVFEAPLCVLESCIRCIVLCITCIFFLVLYLLSFPLAICFQSTTSISVHCTTPLPPLLRVCLLCLYELILTFGLGLSLSIPCCILLIYRDFNGVDEWELHPIPTIFGWMDPRRLAMITLGQGSTAKNSNFLHSPIISSAYQEELMDSFTPPSLLLPLQYPSIFSIPFCFPREILLFLRSR